MPTNELESHIEGCMFRPVLCTACGESVAGFLMEGHKLSECSARSADVTMCEACGENLLPQDLADHSKNSCPEGMIGCMYCGESIRRIDIDVHAIQCEKRPVRASECLVHGKGLASARVGEKAEFRVYATASHVEPEQVAVKARFVQPDEEEITIEGSIRVWEEEEGAGCVASWTPVREGEWQVDVLIRGETVPNSPFMTQVEPALADPMMSCVVLDGASLKVRPGVKTAVVVEARDVYGNLSTHTPIYGQHFHAELVSSSDQGVVTVPCHCHFHGDEGMGSIFKNDHMVLLPGGHKHLPGTYLCTFTVAEPGQYEANVTLNGTAIKGSGFLVLAEPASPRTAAAIKLGVEPGQADICPHCSSAMPTNELESHIEGCMFRPVLCTACGESVAGFLMEGHKLSECSARSADVTMCEACGENLLPQDLADHSKNSCPEGMIGCMYCGESIRRIDIDVHAIQCEKRPVRASECLVHGKGLASARVGEKAEFRVYATASHVEPEQVAVKARFVQPDEEEITIEGSIRVWEEEEGAGCVASWTPVREGEWQVDVLIRGETVPNSPFMTQVEPALADPMMSCVVLDGASLKVRPGVKTAVVVEARDVYGNLSTHTPIYGQHFHAELVSSSDQGVVTVPCHCHFHGDEGMGSIFKNDHMTLLPGGHKHLPGTYLCTFTVAEPGQYEANVTLNGTAIKGSGFLVLAEPTSDASGAKQVAWD